ncbi:hypothetical protein B0H16DRAFT_709174 [Mycena metata]|uniref:F-box domain-containing protein n=1 Tax=Mycena metata TaxID=1033252 RepID=A0AAD7J3L1_9AGAR|nr:hypothetical protein B0H16DRAFT_709174 [Mycena metata]
MFNDALRTQFAELSLAVSQQQLILNDMLARLQILRGQLDSIVYPVLTLPPEISTEIFLQCLPTGCELENPYWDVVQTRSPPLLLTHICGAWRRIALSTPALWTTFYIDVDSLNLVHLSEVAETWFSRARNALSVKIRGSLQTSNVGDLASVVEVFQNHSPRMHFLELHADMDDLRWMDSHSYDFATLRELQIGFMGDEAISQADESIHVFDHIPLLHAVFLHEIPFSFLPCLPWQQLYKFTGEIYPMAECLQVLRLMPNLVECSFAVFEDPADYEVLAHPNLRRLTLFKSTSNVGRVAFSTRILLFLSLPALQTLEARARVDEMVLDSFLRCRPPLVKLSISPFATFRLSRAFVALRLPKLELLNPPLQFLSLFFELFGRDAAFLPELQALSIGCSPAAAFGGVIHDSATAITARMNLVGCTRLQSFRIFTENVVAEEDMLMFQTLKASGTQIYVGPKLDCAMG